MTLDDWIKLAPLLSAGAIAISATVALVVFAYTRRVNRRRATLDMVMRTFLDERGAKIYEQFKAILHRHQDAGDEFTLLNLLTRTAENEKDRNIIIDQLNNYELAALGIRRGLFDERFYKLWFHWQFTKDFESVACLIDAIQAEKPSIYCEFRKLHDRWLKKKHPENHPSWFKMTWWSATRNRDALQKALVGMRD